MTSHIHRDKMIITAVLLMMVAQVIFVWIGYSNAHNVGSEIQTTTDKIMFKYAQNNVITSMNDVIALAARLGSSDFTNYSKSYLNLRDPLQIEEKSNELNQRLIALQISPQNVSKIHILGENTNQKNFAKSVDSDHLSDELIPWIEDLRQADLLEIFLKVYGLPVYFHTGELINKLNLNSHRISVEQKERLHHLFEQLEGHLVINNGLNQFNVMTIITLNPNFLQDILLSDHWDNGYFALINQENHVIWTNLSNQHALDVMLSTRPTQGDLNWNFYTLGVGYNAHLSSLTPYGFELLYATSAYSLTISQYYLLKKYLLFSFMALIVTFIIAYLLSNYIFRPFRALSNLIYAQSSNFPFRTIPESLFLGKWISSISIRNKMMVLLLLSVIVPMISAGILYSWFLYSFSIEQQSKSLTSISSQISLDLKYQMSTFENLIHKLSVDGRLQMYLFNNEGVDATIPNTDPDLFVSLYPELSDVSYFVLYNSSGSARYSSVFLNNLEVFSQKLSMIPDDDKWNEVVWAANKKDVFNRPNISLIKKSLYPVYSHDSASQRVGYLELILKENLFQTINLGYPLDFVILDHLGNLVYQNNSEEQYVSVVKTLNWTGSSQPEVNLKKVDNIDQLIASQKISGTNWHMFVFNSLSSINNKNNELFYRYLVVIAVVAFVAFAIAWILSMFLVRPIERLQMMMNDVGEGNFEQAYEYRGRDEIGKLVRAINTMIKQINYLMQENIKNNVREQELIAMKTRAELTMLQQQINPHFLYNTLEAINMRSRRYGATEVSVMVSSLAQIFRFSINNGDDIVVLESEILHTKNYITIQEIRFPDKFTVIWEIQPGTMGCQVLKFILQPIVENAINHGFMDYSSGGELRIVAKLADMLILEIHDNGVGMEESELDQLISNLESNSNTDAKAKEHETNNRGSSVGLSNVYNRLQMYYEGKATMTIMSENMKGTVIRITFPLDKV